MMINKQRDRAEQNSNNEVSSILQNGKSKAEVIGRTIIADAERKANWTVLSAKGHVITSVLDEVNTRLRALPPSEYLSILQKLIINAGVAIDANRLEVVLRDQDSKLPLQLPTLANAITEKTGKKTELEISSERIESFGGCVVRTADKNVIIDNTFPAILKRREKMLKYEIAKILFSG
jgi:vacuolar-type H+-ATPase subunit E/Vma4